MRKILIAFAVLALAPAPALAATFVVTPTLAPNAFGSPSYATWASNSINCQEIGATSCGTPGDPTYYQAQSTVTAQEGIVTGFPSWKGDADPCTTYGSAFCNEYGNRMTFGLKIDGGGQMFSISDLSFAAHSSDASDALGFAFGAGGYNYSDQYVGFLKGADGQLFTADDVKITSGPNTQQVDGLVGRGSGNSLAAYCTGCTTAQRQQAINDTASYFDKPTTFTGTYSLGQDSGSGTFNIMPMGAVPEPATWAMMLLGFGGIGLMMRRKKKAPRLSVA